MTADGWAPIEPTREETGSPDDPPPPPAHPAGSGQDPRRRRRRWLVAGLGVVVVVAAAAAAFVVASDSGSDGSAAEDGEAASEPAADAPPSEVWSVATRRLNEAGTFAYSGTVESDGQGMTRPGIWQRGELSVEGEVELPELSHEVAIDESGHAVETVSEHVVVWSREAAGPDDLAAQPFTVVAEIDRGMSSSPAGSALIHRWLTAAVDRAADGTDSEGRRRYTGSLHTLLGQYDLAEAAPEPIAEVVLVVDEAGDPARIELASLPGQPALELALDISRIGEPVSIPLPDGRPGAVRGDVTVDQVHAAGISDPVELGALPENWVLYRIDLVPDYPGPGCSTLELAYSDVPLRKDLENALRIEQHSAACPYTLGLTGEPITLGPFTGTVQDEFGGGYTVEASDGVTTIAIYTDMTLANLMAVGASLHPFDPAVGPGPLVPPPAS